MSDLQVKDFGWWERYFNVGGDWERMGGRRQTRVFAEHFLRHAALPRGEAFALLDVGCALGDALELFASTFPKAELQGLDFSATAIARARQSLGDKVTLRQGDIEDVRGHFDVIYCSNTLEHFTDFDRKARGLVRCCKRLFIMVPLHELRAGQPLRPDPCEHHQHTFERDSFDFLIREGLATRIQVSIFACPGAWGWSPAEHVVQFVKNLARTVLGRDWVAAPRQILYGIDVASATSR